MKQRIYKLDNFRAILMFFVVAGHACMFLLFPYRNLFFKLIYIFHMPAFVFLTGICSKPGDPKKVVRRFLLPYVVFQIVYFVFLKIFINAETVFSVTNPIRHLWYLLSAAIWKSVLPLFDTKERKKQIIFLCGSVIAALAAGYFNDIGKNLSLSRTVVFFPFFLTGYYLKGFLTESHGVCTKDSTKLLALLAGVIGVIAVLLLRTKLNSN